jgi:ADP-heptose:LPS heptosyltransferase
MTGYLLFVLSAVVSVLVNRGFRTPRRPYRKILLVRLDHLGDAALTLLAFRRVRESYPGAAITALVGAWNVDLLRGSKDVDEVIVYNGPAFARQRLQRMSLRERLGVVGDLRLKKFDLVIGFRDDFITALMPLFLGCSGRADRGSTRIEYQLCRLLGRSAMFGGYAFPVHDADTNLAVVAPITRQGRGEDEDLFTFSEAEKEWGAEFRARHGIDQNGYAVIHPGAAWQYRRWGEENFAVAGFALFERYGLRTVVIGSEDERELCDRVYTRHPQVFVNAGGRSTVRETLVLMAGARVVICNDSGPMHLAATLGVPTAAVLGPQDVTRFGPRGKQVVWFHKKLECHPCAQRTCKYPDNPCVQRNSVDEVLRGIEQLMNGASRT